MNIIDSLQLPPSARIHINLPKNLLKKHGFTDALLDEIVVQNGKTQCYDNAVITPRTCAIPVYHDETRLYDEIHIIEIDLRTRAHIGALEPLFLQAIPYQIILICSHAKDNHRQYRATAAISRNNQHNADKNILESTVSTDWLDETDAFWSSLAISHLNRRNLFALYNDFYDSICLRNLRHPYPEAVIDRANARALYRAYQQLAEQLDACTTALRRETQFARRLDLVAQIQQIQNQIHALPTQYATSQNECAESVSVRI